jgi:GT2 family glycosyltransferase
MMVTYNRLPLTQRMLEGLQKTTNSTYRLFIVDNGSTDGTVEWLKSMSDETPPIPPNPNCIGSKFFFNKTNLGIAKARNQALRYASKYSDAWFCTIDNDVEMPNNWLPQCLEILTANPKMAIGVNFEGISYPLVNKNGYDVQYKREGNLGTALMVFSRKLFDAIGYFNTEFGLYGTEDADYGFRSRLAGYELAYLKEPGNHFGQGELDQGEYRIFKDKCHAANLAKFRQNCFAYSRKEKPIYLPFDQ